MGNMRLCLVCRGNVGDGQVLCGTTCRKLFEDSINKHKPEPLDEVLHIRDTLPIAVFSDIHAPLTDTGWLLQGLYTAKHFKAQTLILNGDLMDNNEISRHHGHYYRRRKELQDDMQATEEILDLLAEHFQNIYWLSGNHCMERLIKTFKGELNAQRLSKLVSSHKNVHITSRSFVLVNNTILCAHPRQYKRQRGATPASLAQRWQKHVVTGHEHHIAQTASPDGKWQAVCVPAMVDVNSQDYVRNELNDFPEPLCGFAMIFNEKIQLFTQFTPWEIFGLEDLREKI